MKPGDNLLCEFPGGRTWISVYHLSSTTLVLGSRRTQAENCTQSITPSGAMFGEESCQRGNVGGGLYRSGAPQRRAGAIRTEEEKVTRSRGWRRTSDQTARKGVRDLISGGLERTEEGEGRDGAGARWRKTATSDQDRAGPGDHNDGPTQSLQAGETND